MSRRRLFAMAGLSAGATLTAASYAHLVQDADAQNSVSSLLFAKQTAAEQAAGPLGLISSYRTSEATTEGAQQMSSDKTDIRPFHVKFPEAELTELRRRINATRWPDRETVQDEAQGMQLATMKELARLLGDRLRLAQVRGETERPAAVHDRDRWVDIHLCCEPSFLARTIKPLGVGQSGRIRSSSITTRLTS